MVAESTVKTAQPNSATRSFSMSKSRILLVEDDAIVRMDLEYCLRNLGFEIAGSCATAEDAIESVTQSKPDLVLMDIFLPGGLDGVDAAKIINADFRVPVIYLSGFCDEVAIARAKLTDPYGYLLKPYDKETLRNTIEMALDKCRKSGKRKT
jgi:CheY-like chemotaxis protein